VAVRWLTAFLDRPAAGFDVAVAFWAAVTDSTRSPRRGERGQFATLVPRDGDAYLCMEEIVEGPGGSHLDLHVDDLAGFARRARRLGAIEAGDAGGAVVFRSPAGLTSCAVGHRGEVVRPQPGRIAADAGLQLLDQLCIDIPATAFEEECAYWSALTGWELHDSSLHPAFRYLVRPSWSPLRLLLQRRDDDAGAARAHPDFACDEIDALADRHRALGARVVARFPRWTVMTDPAGFPYCLTGRDPRTGRAQ
jgi:Glyoxalase-like domain